MFAKDSVNQFQQRFKGKLSVMDKDGHMGVVVHSSQPIKKNSRPPTNMSYDFLPHVQEPNYFPEKSEMPFQTPKRDPNASINQPYQKPLINKFADPNLQNKNVKDASRRSTKSFDFKNTLPQRPIKGTSKIDLQKVQQIIQNDSSTIELGQQNFELNQLDNISGAFPSPSYFNTPNSNTKDKVVLPNKISEYYSIQMASLPNSNNNQNHYSKRNTSNNLSNRKANNQYELAFSDYEREKKTYNEIFFNSNLPRSFISTPIKPCSEHQTPLKGERCRMNDETSSQILYGPIHPAPIAKPTHLNNFQNAKRITTNSDGYYFGAYSENHPQQTFNTDTLLMQQMNPKDFSFKQLRKAPSFQAHDAIIDSYSSKSSIKNLTKLNGDNFYYGGFDLNRFGSNKNNSSYDLTPSKNKSFVAHQPKNPLNSELYLNLGSIRKIGKSAGPEMRMNYYPENDYFHPSKLTPNNVKNGGTAKNHQRNQFSTANGNYAASSSQSQWRYNDESFNHGYGDAMRHKNIAHLQNSFQMNFLGNLNFNYQLNHISNGTAPPQEKKKGKTVKVPHYQSQEKLAAREYNRLVKKNGIERSKLNQVANTIIFSNNNRGGGNGKQRKINQSYIL